MAPPVQQHRLPRFAGQGQGGMNPLGGAAGEKQAGGHVENLRPEGLRRPDGPAPGEEIPRGGQLGEVNGRNGRQLRRRQGFTLVAGHVHPQGPLGGKGPQSVVQGGGSHKKRLQCGKVGLSIAESGRGHKWERIS